MKQNDIKKSTFVPTTGTIVNNYIDSMKAVLKDKQFGKVGLVFTVHQGTVTGIEEIRETKYLVE